MLKKLTLLAMSVAALVAFAVPAAAQAENPVVTNALGEAAKSITATSGNTVTVASSGNKLECATVTLTVSVGTNTNGYAHGTGNGTASGTVGKTPHTSHCGSSSGAPIDITSITVTTIELGGGFGAGKGTASFDYTFDITNPFTTHQVIAKCSVAGHTSVTYGLGGDELSISGTFTGGGSSAACPTSGTITGDFTVTDEEGSPVTFD